MPGRKRLEAELLRSRHIGLDSSILIYHLEGLRPYSDLTELAISFLASARLTAVISTISVAELLVKPFEEGTKEQIATCEAFLKGLPNTAIVAPDYGTAREAARLRAAYGLRTPDALLLATCLKQRAAGFLTNDEGLKRVEKEGIRILVLDDYLG